MFADRKQNITNNTRMIIFTSTEVKVMNTSVFISII